MPKPHLFGGWFPKKLLSDDPACIYCNMEQDSWQTIPIFELKIEIEFE